MADADRKPSVFISYAHKDGLEFTRRLAFALSFYADVFWDRRLKSGPYPDQLFEEIDRRDFFVLVMTPHSLDSEWCQAELARAQASNDKGILLAHIYPECAGDELAKRYTYGDFTQSFDQGFRRITEMMLGEAQSSWEQLVYDNDDVLMTKLGDGLIPGLIAKEIAEWVLVDRVWSWLEQNLSEQYGVTDVGSPRTFAGVWRASQRLKKKAEEENSVVILERANETYEIAGTHYDRLLSLPDDAHGRIGKAAAEFIAASRQCLLGWCEAVSNVQQYKMIERNFNFDVAEKLRELINMHARRSRYLY